jgi:hypothetical protein
MNIEQGISNEEVGNLQWSKAVWPLGVACPIPRGNIEQGISNEEMGNLQWSKAVWPLGVA